MALALVALLAGLWGGLVRLGLLSTSAVASASEAHGPLMALGFLGTLISLERAVALGRWWCYVAPFAAGLGAIATVASAPGDLGPALVAAGGVVLLVDHVALHRIAPSLHNMVMGLGALAWCAAGVAWLGGADVSRFAPLMAGFLVLTVVGERLELTRVMPRPQYAAPLLMAAVIVFAAGLAVSLSWQSVGVRIAGGGLLAQAVWLASYDVARRTVRKPGATRFMALALLAGYVWLLVAGALWAFDPSMIDGPAYDALLHAVFLGFVMSMVFAHAPVIVPAVLRRPLPFSRLFYVHLALLHLSLGLRVIGGDLAGSVALWQWGGALNEVAILLFLLASAATVLRKPRMAHRSGATWSSTFRAARRLRRDRARLGAVLRLVLRAPADPLRGHRVTRNDDGAVDRPCAVANTHMVHVAQRVRAELTQRRRKQRRTPVG